MVFRFAGIEDAIVSVIRDSVKGKRIGVAFSGGLDSGLASAIASQYAESVTLYTCGTDNAFDVVMARDLAEKLGIPWVHVPISKRVIEMRIREFISATGCSDPFTISYEMPLYCVCKEAKEDYILSGQGADEFFMGCAKFVGQTDEDYEVLKDSSVERLLNVSVPCERTIASHFRKMLIYPYIDQKVIGEVAKIDQKELRPKDMDSRKSVLKEIAADLGQSYIAERKKKSSQYGSGTTDLIRAVAREKGMMYNEYIASVYDDVLCGKVLRERGAVVNARIDPIVKAEAEKILMDQGVSPSQAIEGLYRRIVEQGKYDL